MAAQQENFERFPFLKSFFQPEYRQNILVLFFLFIILILNVLSLRHKTLTYDEEAHFLYGERVLTFQSTRTSLSDDSKMPFSILNSLPRQLGKALKPFLSTKSSNFLNDIKTGRYVTIMFSLVLAIYVYRWTKDLYGVLPGVFSLILYTFAPNIIAHSRLVTTDLYAAALVTISTYYFWRFSKTGGTKRAIVSALTLGLAQIAKYSCIYLYPIFTLTLIIKYSGIILAMLRNKDFVALIKLLKSFLKYLLVFGLISLLVINLGFLFYKTFTPLGEYSFSSQLFKSIQARLKAFRAVPVPLPAPYIEGLDLVKYHEQSGKSFGNIYLFGQLRKKEDFFPGYYFFAFLFKVPIAAHLLILLSFIHYTFNYKQFLFLEDTVFLLAPVVFFFIYFNFFFKAQIGIRFLLLIFPFLYICCGSLLKNWSTAPLRQHGVVTALLLYLIVSVLSYFPHYLSYFNEFVTDRKLSYQVLADSNLDWGQNEWYFNEYLKKHPNVITWPLFPVEGRIVVNANNLLGIDAPEKRYRWLRENFKPISHIAYSYLVYDISIKDLQEKVLGDPERYF